jgi:hypothetical protein
MELFPPNTTIYLVLIILMAKCARPSDRHLTVLQKRNLGKRSAVWDTIILTVL